MSYSRVFSVFLLGLNAKPVVIETDCHLGACTFHLVGLADKSIEEARERVKSALTNSGWRFPQQRLTVNLAPADIKKFGSLYDVGIAVSILLASGQLDVDEKFLEESVFLGELGLTGGIRPVKGILPIVTHLEELGFKNIFLPAANAREASYINNIKVYPLNDLGELIQHLQAGDIIKPIRKSVFKSKAVTDWSKQSLAYIKGQYVAKRALTLAAAGGHNLLFVGSPGSGKTMLAKSVQAILPPLSLEESLEVSKLYSISGLLKKDVGLIMQRPFRCPHHTSSPVSIIGGGRYPLPGEISLAHNGVLFLDEFPELRSLLENLRQPLEDKVVSVSRVSGSVDYPANFMLIAAMNPCPCGYYLDQTATCTCSNLQINNYKKKISGPILDRIDLYVEVPKVKSQELLSHQSEGSDNIKNIYNSICRARAIQGERFKEAGVFVNAQMDNALLQQHCVLDTKSKEYLRTAINSLGLSGRAYYRVLKLARTIADMVGQDNITLEHISEALQYRQQETT